MPYEKKAQNENNLNNNKEFITNEENYSMPNKNEIITKLIEEKNRLKSLIDNCIKLIFETMKENSPDLLDEISNNDNNEDNYNDDEDILDNNNIESYINFVNNNIKKFQSYNKEINSQIQKYKREANENSLRSKEYKEALEQFFNKNNNEEIEENDNIKECKEKNENNENLKKINNFLIEKVKNLEKEVEELKYNNKYLTKSDQTKEELKDSSPVNINVDIEKYYGLLQLLEKEQEKNKLNEDKYLNIINEINNDKKLELIK